MSKKVYVACDHGGRLLKKKIIETFSSEIEFVDLGTESETSVDYPDFASLVCSNMKNDPESFGLLTCGSGQGMAMTANKYPFVRAAICWNEEVAQLAREHNDANILCLGERLMDHDLALKVFKVFLETPFAGGRHQNRVNKIEGTNQ